MTDLDLAVSPSSPRLGALPVRVIFEGEYLLDSLGSAAASVLQYFQRLADLLHSRVCRRGRGLVTSSDAVENRCQVE
jgi:hypothetical protein